MPGLRPHGPGGAPFRSARPARCRCPAEEFRAAVADASWEDRKLLAAYAAAHAAVPPAEDWYEVAHGVTVGLADGLEAAVMIRAAIWSDHPDYREEWKP